MSVRHPGHRGCSTHKHSGRPHTLFVTLLALTGCGTLKELPLSELDSGSFRYRSASPPSFTPTEEPKADASAQAAAQAARSMKQRLVQGDALVEVLLRAGLASASERLPAEAPLSPEDASALFGALLEQPVTVAGFGPRLVASRLLREVVEGDEEVPRAELLERVKRFERLAVLRPDGSLAMALTGAPRQRVGEVQWNEGSFRAGAFEVGSLYSGATGVWRSVDAALQRGWASPVLAEVRDDAAVPGGARGGTEETFIELVLALGQLLPASGDRLTALSRLPEGLATLVASSPPYLERFERLSRGEQVRELSKLSATLLATWGTVVGTPRTLAAMGRGWEASRIPVLSLAADGALAVERVAVPVGRAVTVLGDGPGAVAILHLSSSVAEGARQPEPMGGPGRWGPSRELLSPRAARYHEQLSGHASSEAYWLGEVGKKGPRFDGFAEGVLLEARGPGLASRFNDDLSPKPWFARWGAKELIAQARRQHAAAGGVGARVRWHVAEELAARALRKLLEANQLSEVEVVHTAALP
ncbi:Tox-REase-5 domain-containing protein [Pyxidicoccus trucidator]|uniref:Tox-REase-5 domain-containing protein n=1 Tax=Pyxidicoccus trucidator TaxID=2709662 RepID=UPI0013D9472B|nr:Tox-REase-5 domain-containing protein [Pyxidicoccus trucidator]